MRAHLVLGGGHGGDATGGCGNHARPRRGAGLVLRAPRARAFVVAQGAAMADM